MNVNQLLRTTQHEVMKHGPEILTAAGIIGVTSGAILAVKTTPKAMRILDKAVYKDYQDEHPADDFYSWTDRTGIDYQDGPSWRLVGYLGPKRAIKVLWKTYLPAASAFAVGLVCLVAANRVGAAKTAAATAAYSLAEKTLERYQSKVIEKMDKEDDLNIRSSVSQDIIEANPVSLQSKVTGSGAFLVFDPISGRYFRSDKETIREAVNNFNHELLSNVFMDLNDWYGFIELPSLEIGGQLGWNADKLLGLDFGSCVAEDGEPCLTLEYDFMPSPSFRYGY